MAEETLVKATARAFLVNAGAIAGLAAGFAGAVWATSKIKKTTVQDIIDKIEE